MDLSYASDWLNLAFRWMHIIFGAAWIGASFYFNWLNNSLRPPETPELEEKGVDSTLWAVHGGHFYKVSKFAVAPEALPKTLHWFKWEAYLTWLSGIGLLMIVYWFQSSAFMVDTSVADVAPWVPVAVGAGGLVVGWLVYHGLSSSPLARAPVPFALVTFALLTAVAFGFSQVMSPRAAYIHVGALLGTCMAWNVFFVIIPNQRAMVEAMSVREEPDAAAGYAAAQRSLHNNYMTLPVLFIMVSNHFPMTYGHSFNWAILAALSAIGAGVRHYFNLKGRGQNKVYILPVAAAAMVALAFVTSPTFSASDDDAVGPVSFAEVRLIINQRCLPCHSATPTHELYKEAPAGAMVDTPEQIIARLAKINSMAVQSRTMPLGNLTGMTDEERKKLGRWIQDGAPLDGAGPTPVASP